MRPTLSSRSRRWPLSAFWPVAWVRQAAFIKILSELFTLSPARSAGFTTLNRAVGCLFNLGPAEKDALPARRDPGRETRWTVKSPSSGPTNSAGLCAR